MRLQYKSSARIDLQSFVDHYEEAFRELYRDSGLWNESNIVKGYQKDAAMLYDSIADAVEIRLSGSKVLGRKRLIRSWYEIDFHVGSRLIIVCYSENRREDIRWIESISVDKKPIIF